MRVQHLNRVKQGEVNAKLINKRQINFRNSKQMPRSDEKSHAIATRADIYKRAAVALP